MAVSGISGNCVIRCVGSNVAPYVSSHMASYYLSVINPSAAFSVRIVKDTTISDSAVIYGTVDVNFGDGYDEFSGQSTQQDQLGNIWVYNLLVLN